MKNKKIEFDAVAREEPSAYLIKILEETKKEPTSPAFDNAEEAIAWLHNSKRKYAD